MASDVFIPWHFQSSTLWTHVDAMARRARRFGELCGVGLIGLVGLLSWLGFTSLAATPSPSLPRRVVVAAPAAAALISGGKLPLTVGLSPRMPQDAPGNGPSAKRQRSKLKTITEDLKRKLKDLENMSKVSTRFIFV